MSKEHLYKIFYINKRKFFLTRSWLTESVKTAITKKHPTFKEDVGWFTAKEVNQLMKQASNSEIWGICDSIGRQHTKLKWREWQPYFFGNINTKNNNMKKEIDVLLQTQCSLHWWNFGKKTLSFKGNLGDLLKTHGLTFKVKKTETEGVFLFSFDNQNGGITFKRRGVMFDFTTYAKQFIQMELVRMGDKSLLYVGRSWRPTVSVNF